MLWTRLRLNLLLALRRRGLLRWLVLSRWRRLLRTRLRLNLLLTLLGRWSRSWLVLSRWGRLLRTGLRLRLRLNLLLARGWRRCGSGLISRRLVAVRWCVWRWRGGRRWLRAGPCGGRRLIAIRLNILLRRGRLLSCVGLPGSVRRLRLRCVGLLRCVRRRGGWRRARSRSGTWRDYRGDGFALRDWLGHSNDGGFSVVDGSELLAILRGLFAMLNLSGHRGNTLFARGS